MILPFVLRHALWLVALISLLASANIFLKPIAPPVQNVLTISSKQEGRSLPDGFLVYKRLDQHGIQIKSITPEHDTLVVRLALPEQQSEALTILMALLPQGYRVSDEC